MTNTNAQDYNKSINPLMQRLLYGVMVVSGIATGVITLVVFLIYEGVLPVGWFQ